MAVMLVALSVWSIFFFIEKEIAEKRELERYFTCRQDILVQEAKCSILGERLFIRYGSNSTATAACWDSETGAFRPIAVCRGTTAWETFEDPSIATHKKRLPSSWKAVQLKSTEETH